MNNNASYFSMCDKNILGCLPGDNCGEAEHEDVEGDVDEVEGGQALHQLVKVWLGGLH